MTLKKFDQLKRLFSIALKAPYIFVWGFYIFIKIGQIYLKNVYLILGLCKLFFFHSQFPIKKTPQLHGYPFIS